MSSVTRSAVVRPIYRLFDEGTLVGSSDAELLERFVARRDERAFEALIIRHGRSVQAVCRDVLRDAHDAEDAFQATFLILARKAGSLWVGNSLAAWLHRVAPPGRRRGEPAEGPAAGRRNDGAGRGLRPNEDFTIPVVGNLTAGTARRDRPTAGEISSPDHPLRPGRADARRGGPTAGLAARHGRRSTGAGPRLAEGSTRPPRACRMEWTHGDFLDTRCGVW